MENLHFIFCHGLNGSGQYDESYKKHPYWGGKSGDMIAEYNNKGYRAYAASVSPQGSAWDRACELYAQIAGVKTDYGRAHSEKYRHARFGKDYSNQPLIPAWNEKTRIVLIGHSFGGATIRLLSALLSDGSEEERKVTPDNEISDLFKGGMSERIFAIVTLAAPTNGTSAYSLGMDPNFNADKTGLPFYYQIIGKITSAFTAIKKSDRDPQDYADYDMIPDNAMALNKTIPTLANVYYFSVAANATYMDSDGTWKPNRTIMDALFMNNSVNMGKYTGTTPGGYVIDEKWFPNDGLVNTYSARAPFDAPQKNFDKNNIEKGIWNIMPDYIADHGAFQGGFFKKHNPRPFFDGLLKMISDLPR